MEAGRILHLIDTGGPGGAETVFHNLVTGLDPHRWRSIPVVPERDWLDRSLRQYGLEPILLTTQGSFDWRYLAKLSAVIRAHRVELVHTHLLTSSVYGSLIGRALGVPVVCTFHGQADIEQRAHRRAKLGVLNHCATRVIFVSEALRRHFLIRTQLDPARTEVIYNGVDMNYFSPGGDRSVRQEFGIAEDQILVGSIGNVRPSKDYPNLLRTAAELRTTSSAFRFLVVGATNHPEFDEVLRLQRELGLENTVLFTGFREDVPRVLRSFDAFLLSSLQEGFSLATVQAMAAGIPVVATRCGGPEEIVEDGISGMLVPPRRPEALAQALRNLFSDSEIGRTFAERGRASAAVNFSRSTMIARYEALYTRCIARPLGGS